MKIFLYISAAKFFRCGLKNWRRKSKIKIRQYVDLLHEKLCKCFLYIIYNNFEVLFKIAR